MRALRLIAVLALLSACGDDGGGECRGVGDAMVSGVEIQAGAVTMGYGDFIWGANNDCGMDSITIRGGQISPAPGDLGIGLCITQPADVGSAPVPLTSDGLVSLVGAGGEAGGCTYQPSDGAMPVGTVTFGGLCTQAGASFTVTFAASIAGERVCDAAPEGVTMIFSGTGLVRAQ